MTVKELKDIVNSISDEYNECKLFTDVGFNEFADVDDLARIAEPKVDNYKIPKDRFYVGFVTK
jgi:hypothetical protein